MKQLTFIDNATIKVKPGKGGDGARSFHREKFIQKGGPDGGNGGHGGNVFLIAKNDENSLLKFRRKQNWKSESGENGGNSNQTGKSGKDLLISIPLGTEVIINNEKKIDLSYEGQIYLVREGGKGGRGNASFKSSKNKAPTLFELGENPEVMEIELNLKVLADVGLLGFPNVGKSTFLKSITNAKPKIGNYEFTTLVPQLGIVRSLIRDFVITDLPGLIEGANQNKGMGIQFLKHLERCKMIIHMVDGSADDKLEKYESLRNELVHFSSKLINLKEIIVISKSDLIDDEERKEIKKLFKGTIYFISSVNREGIKDIVVKIAQEILEKDKQNEEEMNAIFEKDFIHIKFEDTEIADNWTFEKNNNIWKLKGDYLKYWGNRIPLDSVDNRNRLLAKYKSKNVFKKLKKHGIKEGDIVMIEDTSFVFEWEEIS